ncbi:hypothetical protein Ait01nite_053210 [Actinoplanes italicus]|uniref:Uncharacterized protein n=1 Tax=Actinoplanes italicus TaxID=113567 RepID=A0A2T0JZL9_9ACTN|nr:hypothetical protein [Actinoplanes italicus]PRX15965.1 hypothetical protein CLV67_12112 [Actinoplanes italicus]GIE32276.1 hypothetical protein Ait01nite_053210 [Actinoplanes italicus]
MGDTDHGPRRPSRFGALQISVTTRAEGKPRSGAAAIAGSHDGAQPTKAIVTAWRRAYPGFRLRTGEVSTMAIPRKGSRLITVDGMVYRWAVRAKPTYCQGLNWGRLTFAVEHADTPGQVLSVETRSPRLDNWLNLPGRPVTPLTVEQSVRIALAAGWEPDRSDGVFRLAPED